jgi:DNA-binding transcriptional ArsR family regulator
MVPVGCGLDAAPFDGDEFALHAEQLLQEALRLLVATLAEVVVADDSLPVDEVERWPVVGLRSRCSYNDSSTQRYSCGMVSHMNATSNVPHPLPAPLVELIAERFRVLGEPMRIRLLDALREAPATVGDLQQATGASQQNVSKHLGLLLRSGLVSRSKEGNFSLSAIADEGVFELCEQVCGGLRRHLDELDSLLPAGTNQ